MSIQVLKDKLGVIIAMITIVGAVLAYTDIRYASAAGVKELTSEFREVRVAMVEYEIKEAERRIRRIELTPEQERTPYQQYDLIELLDRREYLLRELKRLESE